ncbi:MAG TPA: class I SAM-dependent methyltransferase [Acidimicrobiia bacterium]|nr:class I SAM-dependent methyltransferase [Acidimicrobiia bacterium]
MGSLRDAWEAQAENWAAWARTPGHDVYFWRVNLPPFLDLLPAAGRLTLDLGCGEGRLGRILEERGHRVVSVDSSQTLVRLARTHEQSQPVVLSDVAHLPVRDAGADLAIAFMSLHDVDDLDGAVFEAARALVPGGRFCVSIVHPINAAGKFVDKTANSVFLIAGSYLEQFRYSDEVERDGLPMVFHSYHRPLGMYARAFEKAGFVIDALREPADPVSGVEHARWRRLPLFLHIRAVRQ